MKRQWNSNSTTSGELELKDDKLMMHRCARLVWRVMFKVSRHSRHVTYQKWGNCTVARRWSSSRELSVLPCWESQPHWHLIVLAETGNLQTCIISLVFNFQVSGLSIFLIFSLLFSYLINKLIVIQNPHSCRLSISCNCYSDYYWYNNKTGF